MASVGVKGRQRTLWKPHPRGMVGSELRPRAWPSSEGRERGGAEAGGQEVGGDRRGVLSIEGRQPAGVPFQGSCLRNAVALVPKVART